MIKITRFHTNLKKFFFILNEQIYLDEPVSDEADLLFIWRFFSKTNQ
jgi:hypothetical protein